MRVRPRPVLALVALLAASPLALGGGEDGLVPWFEKDSLAFHHVRYRQVVDGLPVLDAGGSDHVAKRDPSLAVRHRDLAPVTPRGGGLSLAQDDAVARAVDAVGALALRRDAEVERAWAQTPDGLRKAYVVRLDVHDPPGAWRVAVDGATGAVLDVRDLALRFEAEGRVFRANPIVALQDPALRDNRLSVDDGRFDAAMMDVAFNVTGPGFRGRWIVIEDALAAPQEGDTLAFRRDDPRFLEAMAFWYAEEGLARLAALGYEDLVAGEVSVRAHDVPAFRFFGVAGERVPSYPSPWPDAYVPDDSHIYFMWRAPAPDGPGFGSSAEDGEVVLHELGHILHLHAAPDVERNDFFGTWAEGTSDAYAALLLDDLDEGYGDPCMAEWLTQYYTGAVAGRFVRLDEHDGLLCLRDISADIVWPDDREGRPHRDGRFWAGVLWDARQAYGTDAALVLLTETLHLLPAETDGFEDLAQALLLADRGLTGGARAELLAASFERRGLEVPALPPLAPDDLELAEGAARTPGVGALAGLALLGAVALVARRR